MAPCYCPGRTIVPATKDRFTNNLPDLSQLLCVPINTDELDTITSNMGTIFSNTLETVAPIKLKKVREKHAAPWYNSYTHSLKKETRILERKWRKTNLEVFRIVWKNSMSSYRQAIKVARTEHIRKLIDNHQNNPRILFSTVARSTNKQMSPNLNIPSQFNCNDRNNIRNIITNVDSTASSTSFIAPKEKLHCFTTIGQDEVNKCITASKPTTCLLDPVPTKLLKELLPVAEEPLLNIINSSLSLGHVPKPFKLAVIKPLIKKPKLDHCELANYRPISILPFISKKLTKLFHSLCIWVPSCWPWQNLAFNLEIKVPESGGRLERHRIQAAWSPVWSFRSQWWFGVSLRPLVLVHCVLSSPKSMQPSTRRFWSTLYFSISCL